MILNLYWPYSFILIHIALQYSTPYKTYSIVLHSTLCRYLRTEIHRRRPQLPCRTVMPFRTVSPSSSTPTTLIYNFS